MAESAAAAIQDHLADTKKRKRTAWRFFWMLLAGFGLLLIGVPLVVYLSWQAHGRRLLRDELAAIQAKGEPITTSELAAWYAPPAGERDITAIWLVAIEPFESPAHTAAAASVPIVGNGGPAPPIDQPWADPEAVKNYLQTYEQEIAALHAAAKEQGVVRFPRQFSQGIGMLLPDVQKLRSCVRALSLELQQKLRDKDASAAMEILETQYAVGQIIDHDPILISLLVRIALQGMTLADIRITAEALPLTDEQLARLQQLVRKMQVQQQLSDSLLGERAMVYHSFHHSVFALQGDLSGSGQFDLETTHDVRRVGRPEDCAMAIGMLTRMRDATQQEPAKAIEAADALDQELKQLVGGNGSSLNRLRYMQTMLLVPAVNAVCTANARIIAQRDITDCLLALRRYELKHGQPPAALADLVPDFLPQVPLDPYTSKSALQLKTSGGETLVYSVGKDRIDNGGLTDANGLEPDVVLKYKARQ